jgi:hypothetical protein
MDVNTCFVGNGALAFTVLSQYYSTSVAEVRLVSSPFVITLAVVGLVVSVPTTEPKVRGFKTGRG